VVLAWPHKDCILEGGQSKDDEKNNEVFYNEILSRDEIDRLFEPKALTNIKRYSRHSELDSESKEGLRIESAMTIDEITIEDNLILKGNNLIALHSLKKKYAGKVKLIYIDPPYNTGNDSFKYNDKFNHSTWLTFMKNRLEVAKELLRDDGVIFVSIDDNEQAYLKILMDEVFKSENFLGTLIWKRRVSSALSENNLSTDHEYVLAYQKKLFKNFAGIVKNFKNYKNPDDDPRGDWIADNLTVGMTDKMRPNQAYDLVDPDTGNSYPYNPNRVWAYIPESMNKLLTEKRVIFPADPSKRPMLKRFRSELKSDCNPLSTLLMDQVGLNTEATRLLQQFFGSNIFDYSKPLSLLSTLIRQVASEKNDIILDFHAGSGTTAQAVLDLNKEDGGNRKFILIEQMDYIETVTCERVKKVIEKNGEGSFIYAELKQIDTFKEAEIGKLNCNMHYLPVNEIEDEEYGISEEEIALNKQFYGLENV
jgi:adenine-specific DNA-methyltransferase